MTKVGKGEGPVHEPTSIQYRRELDHRAGKFLHALGEYHGSREGKTKAHWKGVMDEELQLIRAVVSELKRAGMYKQEVKIEKEYHAYLASGSEGDFGALEHNLQTLKDYTQIT